MQNRGRRAPALRGPVLLGTLACLAFVFAYPLPGVKRCGRVPGPRRNVAAKGFAGRCTPHGVPPSVFSMLLGGVT
jgi:hypothetical protein